MAAVHRHWCKCHHQLAWKTETYHSSDHAYTAALQTTCAEEGRSHQRPAERPTECHGDALVTNLLMKIRLPGRKTTTTINTTKQQTVANEATDEWKRHIKLVSVQREANLNICSNNGCSMFSVNMFTLNGRTFYDCCSFLLQYWGVRVWWHRVKLLLWN